MFYCVQMEVRVPHDADPERLDRLKANEKARAQDLQRDGKWIHLWRVAGRYAAALKRLAAARETTVRELMAKAFNLLLAADRAEHPGEDDPTKGIIFDEAPSARGGAAHRRFVPPSKTETTVSPPASCRQLGFR